MTSPHSSQAESRHYPTEGLSVQIRRGFDFFIGLHDGTSLNQVDREFLSPFIERLLISRTKRASEISSPDYLRIIDLLMTPKEKGGLFNNPNIFGVDCIDGRVLPVFVAGLIAKFGGMIRVPAGDLTEFKRSNGQTLLLKESNFAKRLEEAFDNRGVDHITQLFDSHLYCAAREKSENVRKHFPSDHGLYVDVRRKKEIAGATIRYTKDKYDSKKWVTPIQISFDPHTGYLYMGLETHYSMKEAKKHGNVFFDESTEAKNKGEDFNLLTTMAQKGEIISTELLSKDPEVKKILEAERLTDMDWENNYVRTAGSFWKKILKLQKTDLYATINIKLAGIYPEIARSANGKEEIEDRATIILTNLFSTYCLTKGGEKPFPHKEHREEIGVVSEGGYSPFPEIPSFGINILDIKNLAANARLAYDIIINNRSNNVKTRIDSPVVIMVQHMIRTGPRDKIWKELNDADFQKLLTRLPDASWFGKNWIEMDDIEFGNCMKANFNIKNPKIIEELNKLRHAIIVLYKKTSKDDSLYKLFPQFKEETDNRARLIIVPALADQNRGVQAIIPFMSN